MARTRLFALGVFFPRRPLLDEVEKKKSPDQQRLSQPVNANSRHCYRHPDKLKRKKKILSLYDLQGEYKWKKRWNDER